MKITQNGETFDVIDEAYSEFTELVKSILASHTMDAGEKQYWFDILPSMTDEQIERLTAVLKKDSEPVRQP